MDNQTLPSTFESLYKKGCQLLQDTEANLLTYQELDVLYQFILNHPEKKAFMHALSPKRVCIVMPYHMFPDKRLPPDMETAEGVVAICACPGYDKYQSILIDHMTLTEGTTQYANFGSVPMFNKWKLARLSKVLDIGWPAFAEGYLKPLQDKQKYLADFFAMAASK